MSDVPTPPGLRGHRPSRAEWIGRIERLALAEREAGLHQRLQEDLPPDEEIEEGRETPPPE